MSKKLSRRDFIKMSASAALGATVLAACQPTAAPQTGGQSDEPTKAPATATPVPEEQKELGFAWWTGGEAANAVFNEAVDHFEEAFPQYTVNRITVPGGGEFHTKMLAMYGAGNAPDCHGVQWGQVWLFAHKGILADLTPLNDADPQNIEEMWPAILEMLYYPFGSDKLVCLPRETFGLKIFPYNKEIYEAAGVPTPAEDYDAGNWNWDTWRERAKAVTKFDGDRRDIMGASVSTGMWELAWVMPTLGVSMLNAEGTHYNLDDPAVKDWLQMVVDMINTDRSLGKDEETAEFSWMGSGKQAIGSDATWGIPNFNAEWEFDWDFVPPPAGVAASNFAGCDFHAVNGSDYADKAGGWSLISFLNSPDEDLWWGLNMFGPPFRKSNVDKWSTEVNADIPLNGFNYVDDMTAAASAWPAVPFYPEMSEIHENEIGQIKTMERTVDDVVESIVTKVDEMIADFE
jgi:maltose-binding protein MalE